MQNDSWLGYESTKAAWAAALSSAPQRLVLLCIAKYSDAAGVSFPSVETISSDTLLNRKTVFKILKELQALGFLQISKRTQNHSNSYQIVRSSTKNGTTENGTTEFGTSQKRYLGSTKNGTYVVPNLGQEEYQEEYQEKSNGDCPKKSPKKRSAITHRFTLQTIPPEWASYCIQVRPDLNPNREFQSFLFYFTQGKGSSTIRSDKGWNQSWQGWIRRAKETPRAEVNNRDDWKVKPENNWREEQEAKERANGLDHQKAIMAFLRSEKCQSA